MGKARQWQVPLRSGRKLRGEPQHGGQFFTAGDTVGFTDSGLPVDLYRVAASFENSEKDRGRRLLPALLVGRYGSV